MRVCEVMVENFRCFRRPTAIPFGRITLLVGENSTGKSALLAVLGGFFPFGKQFSPFAPDFNEAPFQLGRFEDIVTRRTRMPDQSRTFKIGVSVDVPADTRDRPARVCMVGEYENHDGQPIARTFRMSALDFVISVRRRDAGQGVEYEFAGCQVSETQGGTKPTLEQLAVGKLCGGRNLRYERLPVTEEMLSGITPFWLLSLWGLFDSKAERGRIGRVLQVVGRLTDATVHHLAPIRAVPHRTYESYAVRNTPEGTHVPFIIERVTRSSESSELLKALRTFGEESGLFSDIEVRRFGEPKGSRFAVFVKIGGALRNIADVGYGVPQALPPVIDALRLSKGSVVTMQEPEVHLHPRAQAALGSLLVRTAVAGDKSFIVETHSDYLVDRVRREVASGKIDNHEVVILFFEQAANGCRVTPILVDQRGRPVGAPNGYRDFFLKEALSMLEVE